MLLKSGFNIRLNPNYIGTTPLDDLLNKGRNACKETYRDQDKGESHAVLDRVSDFEGDRKMMEQGR